MGLTTVQRYCAAYDEPLCEVSMFVQ